MKEIVQRKKIKNANRLTKAMNEEGIKPPRSKKWYPASVLMTLRDATKEGILSKDIFEEIRNEAQVAERPYL